MTVKGAVHTKMRIQSVSSHPDADVKFPHDRDIIYNLDVQPRLFAHFRGNISAFKEVCKHHI